MSKYGFLVFHKERDAFLEKLQDIGVVHVITKGAVLDEQTLELANRIRESEVILKRFGKRKVHLRPELMESDMEVFPMLVGVAEMESELEEIQRKKILYAKQIEMLEPWGVIPSGLLERLKNDSGVHCRFYQYPENKFEKEWEQQYALEVINRKGGAVYFVNFTQEEDSSFPVRHLPLPKDSLEDSRAQLNACNLRELEINDILNDMASKYFLHLEQQIVEAKDQLDFKNISQQVDRLETHKLVVLEGWCPKTRESDLVEALEKDKVVYLASKPGLDEATPVLLRNNAFTKLFEPIGNMFSLPASSEMDLTPFFAPFFLLFFGFCLGDAGYGVVIFLAATIAKFIIKKTFKPYLTLLQLFGMSTTVMGFFSGTLFGLELLKVEAFESMRQLFMTQDQLFNAALVIGFVQIIFGMGVSVYKKIVFEGWLQGMSKIGWIITLLSLVDIMLIKGIPAVTSVSVWMGVGMVVLFGNPKSGPLKSIGFGLADLYNITGVMGDLLSYIRLFALGVSSAILGLVVNEIAMSAKGIPYVGFVVFILILVLGHTGNMMLAALSAFVHPMRLTFVEFYKNTGFLGGGKPYNPFRRKSASFKASKQ
ncbi:MAG: hypothetical protein GY751_17275 [Bacteroidetes bacterium]|nr:hypothetical protein [Bacteroidota bacterium]